MAAAVRGSSAHGRPVGSLQSVRRRSGASVSRYGGHQPGEADGCLAQAECDERPRVGAPVGSSPGVTPGRSEGIEAVRFCAQRYGQSSRRHGQPDGRLHGRLFLTDVYRRARGGRMKLEGSTERKLTRARTQLLLNQPFFGSLCLRLKLEPGPVPTMATDGKRILYNPAFVDSLKPSEIEGTFAHEVMHCALGHHCRRGTRDRQVWNEAADLAINPILIGNRFTLPSGALIDPAFDNLSAEEIYSRLLRDKNDDSGAGSK